MRGIALVLVATVACGGDDGEGAVETPVRADQVVVIEDYDPSALNADLVAGEPTVDVGFYVTEDGPVTWDELVPGIERTKRIYAAVGIQIRVSAAMQIRVPSDWQALDPNQLQMPSDPSLLETDLYAHLEAVAARLTDRNREILEAIVWQYPGQDHGGEAEDAVHVVTLSEVPIAYYEWDGMSWSLQSAPTGGLSFPPYIHGDRIPRRIRGVISWSVNPNPLDMGTRVLAHELGHKLINVSHEGVDVCPSFEADGDDLMLYGGGERIASGASGRWHRERLALSPFLYRLEATRAVFDNRFEDGGRYGDGLYGSYVVEPPCGSSGP